ncbi:pectate lyase [Asanoa sp. WMMD1127]|uniref:pectate lyase family protein n=1 Tax=Asanoa sp. WMMD1127 TaxID=3016107 RepID=UPI002416B557|nr:pectate lyase [Asanoa sp. WMMD1127]MDG4823912.1 pectate lyase [Asanoa sp. WMMD1127]
MRRAVIAALGAAALVGVLLSSAAQAATLFGDDFADGNASGWSTSGGSWSVAGGAYRQSSTGADAKAQAGSTTWADYAVRATVTPVAFGSSARSVGVVARAQNTTTFYSLVLVGAGRVELRRVSGGSVTVLSSAATGVTPGTAYQLTLTVAGSALRGAVGGQELVAATDSTFGRGRIGLVASYAGAVFDDVSVFTGAGPDPTPTATPTATPTGGPTTPPPPPPLPGRPDGFASVAGLGLSGTTGGAGGPTVTVTTAAALAEFAGAPTPYTIMVSGRIAIDDMVTVVANKSIIGVGSTAEITGGGLQLGTTTRPGNNVIIRNIRFSDASDDSISVTNAAHHVWIDHNEFLPGFDGSVDVKRQSTFVTVSWNRFTGTDKSMLLGHSDSYPADVGYLKVTYHHNLFDGANQRHPRARFGEPVHVYNNYYRDIGLYGVASTENAGLVVEGNYFENVAFPCHSVSGYADSGPGRLVQRGNAFVNSGVCEAGGAVQEPSAYYSYTLSPASSVPSAVTAGAGVGRL